MAQNRTERESRPKKNSLGFTIVVAAVVFIYIAAMFVQFLTQTSMNYMIATEGNMEESFMVQGAITREEVLVTATSKGVVQYYYPGGKRLASNIKVGVMMDSYYGGLLEEKLDAVYRQLEETDTEYEEVFARIREEISETVAEYLQRKDYNGYESVYLLKADLEEYMERRQELFALSNNKTVVSLLEQEGVYLTEKEQEETNLWINRPGIIEYSFDGYEGWTAEQITENFCSEYKSTYTRMNVQMQQRDKGDPLFRLITSETWNVTTYLSKEQAQMISDKKTVDFWFDDKEKLTGTVLSLTEEESGRYKLIIKMNSRMMEYADQRVVQLRYVQQTITGIKISDRCIVEQSFYCVPQEYIVTSGRKKGVLKMTEDGVSFVAVDVQHTAEEMVYFRLPEGLQQGDTIQAQESEEKINLVQTRQLTGVYIVNGGNENFTVIEIVHQEQGYSIVTGIALYDRVMIVGDEQNAK